MSKYTRSDEGQTLKVKYKDGSVDTVTVREMTHKESTERQRKLFGSMGRKQKGGMRSINLDKQREYDWKISILNWVDEEGNPPTDDNGNVLDFRSMDFLDDLPRYVVEQVFNFIDEINEEPEDEVAPSENGHGTEVVEEDPTYTSSESRSFTG